MTANDITRLLWATIVRPQETAVTILEMRPSREAVWLGAALVTVLSVLLVGVLEMMTPAPPPPAETDAAARIVLSPLVYGLLLGASLVLSAAALNWAGRAFGGQGGFGQALTLMVWLQFLLLILQAMQVLLVVLVPPFGILLALASFAIMLWCLVHFIKVLHGFGGLGKATLTLIVAFLGLGIGLALVLSAASAQIPEMP